VSKDPPEWKLVEEVAARLEAALAPHAVVSSNVQLPVLGSSRRRQCDVVITMGRPPRETVSIVEVQKRKAKPDITTFHGWLQKMREVGAQHLICVSEAGYPASILEEVSQRIGPTVRLLTLSELQDINEVRRAVPSAGMNYKRHCPRVTRVRIVVARPGGTRVGLTPKTTRMATAQLLEGSHFLMTQAKQRTSVEQLAARFVETSFFDAEQQEVVADLLQVAGPLLCVIPSQSGRVVEMRATISITVQFEFIPFRVSEYRHDDRQGSVAWVSTARAEDEDRVIDVQLIYVLEEDGRLDLRDIRQIGVDSVDIVGITAAGQRVVFREYAKPQQGDLTTWDLKFRRAEGPVGPTPADEKLSDE